MAALPRVAWDNAALSLLERTLDDSANRRLMLPEAFLAVDEMLRAAAGLIHDLNIHPEAIERNLQAYGTFAAVERLLMALGKAGADRQVMHERLRAHSMQAWNRVTKGEPNPLYELIRADDEDHAVYSGRPDRGAARCAAAYRGCPGTRAGAGGGDSAHDWI